MLMGPGGRWAWGTMTVGLAIAHKGDVDGRGSACAGWASAARKNEPLGGDGRGARRSICVGVFVCGGGHVRGYLPPSPRFVQTTVDLRVRFDADPADSAGRLARRSARGSLNLRRLVQCWDIVHTRGPWTAVDSTKTYRRVE
jgi:hypothetical protein